MHKILVIDDSALMRNILSEALGAEGFQVEGFLPASEDGLMEKLKDYIPDLLITDFNMPVLDGKAVARATRFALPATKIVLLTASRDAARDAQLQTMGVRRILHKPIKAEDVVQAVKELLRVS